MINTRLLAFSIAASACFTITAVAATASAFVDVSASHSNSEAITYVKAEGIVEGYPDGTFKPNQTINRAEFTKIVVEAQYEQEEIDDLLSRVRLAAVADIDGDAWYAMYVNFARAKGIVGGYPDGTFKPSATINFVEASKIIVNAYELPTTETGVWFEGYVRALDELNAIPSSISGFDDQLTRGEMAEIIWRLETENTTETTVSYEQLSGDEERDNDDHDNPTYIGPGCKIGGCSSQLCVNANSDDVISTCEWREEYACYQTARCEQQTDGNCGWTQTEELTSCLNKDSGSSCALILCAQGSICRNGSCYPIE